MKENQPVFSLESIDFLFRRFGLVVSSFVVIMSITFGYLANVPPQYKCEAIISFSPSGGEVWDEKFLDRKDSIINSLLLGQSARVLVEKIWPDLDEEKNLLVFDQKLNMLRNRLRMDRPKQQRHLLYISFTDTNPDLCLKIVQSAIDTIISLSKLSTEKEIETKITFLEKQLDFYKKRMGDIDVNIIAIHNKLKKQFPEMSPEDRALVAQVMRGTAPEGSEETTQGKIRAYDGMLAELNLQLLEAEKEKSILEKQLKTGRFFVEPSVRADFETDAYVQEYNRAIAAKHLEMAELKAKGYMPLHPALKKLERETGDLEALKNQLIEGLKKDVDPRASEKAKLAAEENAKQRVDQMDIEIETIKEKMAYMQQSKEKAREEMASVETRASAISEDVAQLLDLQNEKTISYNYYRELKRKLEEERIRSRIEEEEAGFVIRVVEPPEKPLQPIPFQKMAQIFMGVMIGLGVGAGLAYAVDMLDNSVRSSSDLRELLGIPVLGAIDHIGTLTEISLKKTRRTAVVIGLLVFALLSRFVVKFFMSFLGK